MIEAALAAGKHVLSQKPFVLDLDAGARLCDLADAKGVRLAVNQNGRWAPHLAWMREAVRAGLVGAVHAVDIAIHWDHGWIAGTPFEAIDDLILYDFAVHWFDFLASLGVRADLGLRRARPRRRARPSARRCWPQALVAFDGGQAALAFDGAARFGADGPHLHRRQRRHAGQRRPEPRRPGGDARRPPRASRGRGSTAPGSARASSARWARCSAAIEDGREPLERRARQPRRAGAGLRRDRLVARRRCRCAPGRCAALPKRAG